MRIIRVFPRRTNATPIDDMVRIAEPPGMFDEADEIHISVAFEWDKPIADWLERQWRYVAPVKMGGPAYGDPGGEFVPEMYIKRGYVITSRGCPNRCWFCRAWRNEGNEVRELIIHNGFNVLDNNLLACSMGHQKRVFEMLLKQKERPRFTGGFEALRFTEWHAEWMVKLNPEPIYFAFDTPDDYEPLVNTARILSQYDVIRKHKRSVRCYVLIGYKNDTIENAQNRLMMVAKLGIMPMAMLYDQGKHTENAVSWKRFQREWANSIIVGKKLQEMS